MLKAGGRYTGAHYAILFLFKYLKISISGQDRGVGRYTSLPCTTKRRTITNLKTKNNQNCQKIELYGSPTTKELKKKHSSSLVGGAETGSQDEEHTRQDSSWSSRQSYLHMWRNGEEHLGSDTNHTTQGSSVGN